MQDPYVVATLFPGGATQRTKAAVGGGTDPAWTAVGHNAHFYFDIDTGIRHTIRFEVKNEHDFFAGPIGAAEMVLPRSHHEYVEGTAWHRINGRKALEVHDADSW
jgi:hypothetical protein